MSKMVRAAAGAVAMLVASLPRLHDARAETAPVLGLGDSLGAGVQSADDRLATQRNSYVNLVTRRISAPSILPWIRGGVLTRVGSTAGRSRFFPNLAPTNLSVSGADVHDILYTQADALTEAQIDSEEDLIEFPRTGSQVEIAESLTTYLILCWIGSNDALSAVLDFSHLDASQLTPVADFETDFDEIVSRLHAIGAPVVFANIPDVTDIGYLMNGDDLTAVFGSDFGLAPGSWTTVPTAFLIAQGVLPPFVVLLPNFVLNAAEIATIEARIDAFNGIIDDAAGAYGYPVVDIHTLFADAAAVPPVIAGHTLTRSFLGGLFSLDGVHPSNIGHALVANAFIEAINARYGTSIAPFSNAELAAITLADPFVDKDGDGVVRGRPLAGAVETVAALVGFSGDPDDGDPSVSVDSAATAATAATAPATSALLAAFRALQ
jgi:lysophospholipase L1-like esterase